LIRLAGVVAAPSLHKKGEFQVRGSVLRQRKHGAWRCDAAQDMRSERDQRHFGLRGERGRHNDRLPKRTAQPLQPTDQIHGRADGREIKARQWASSRCCIGASSSGISGVAICLLHGGEARFQFCDNAFKCVDPGSLQLSNIVIRQGLLVEFINEPQTTGSDLFLRGKRPSHPGDASGNCYCCGNEDCRSARPAGTASCAGAIGQPGLSGSCECASGTH
jgi:hypothetical protein